jgi:hypothetical protein
MGYPKREWWQLPQGLRRRLYRRAVLRWQGKLPLFTPARAVQRTT